MRPKIKICKGDRVKVIAGRDKGKTGDVLKVIPAESRVLVQGINVVKRHTRPSQVNPEGGIVSKEKSIHVSNVMVLDSSDKTTRIGYKMEGDNKVRVAKRTGEVIEKSRA